MTTPAPGHDTVLVLDFGAQYAQLIARRIRECHVFSEVVPCDVDPETVRAHDAKALVLSGGPKSVYEPGAPALDPRLLELGIPVLGLCYGQQAMARAWAAGSRRPGSGSTAAPPCAPSPRAACCSATCPTQQVVWMSHGDTVTAAPPGARVVASTDASPVAGFEDPERGLYGVQFHPEVAHTERGMDLFKNFLYEAAGCRPNWTSVSIIEEQEAAVRARVGDGHVLCALSGGVDSSVAALLVHRAVGDKLTCVFVDTGLLRHGEAEQVEETFRRDFKVNLVHVKAADRFLERLAGVTDPEAKRKAIGNEFIRVFEEVAKEHGDARYLVQGTLYPDVVESGRPSATPPSRATTTSAGCPRAWTWSWSSRCACCSRTRSAGSAPSSACPRTWSSASPSPAPAWPCGSSARSPPSGWRPCGRPTGSCSRRSAGPGWTASCGSGSRCCRRSGPSGSWATAAPTPTRSCCRAVTSQDAMTADFARLPWEVLERISTRVVGEVPGVNRVAYDVTSKPPGTIEWE